MLLAPAPWRVQAPRRQGLCPWESHSLSILGVELSPEELASMNPTFLASQKFRVSTSELAHIPGVDAELREKQEIVSSGDKGGSSQPPPMCITPKKSELQEFALTPGSSWLCFLLPASAAFSPSASGHISL